MIIDMNKSVDYLLEYAATQTDPAIIAKLKNVCDHMVAEVLGDTYKVLATLSRKHEIHFHNYSPMGEMISPKGLEAIRAHYVTLDRKAVIFRMDEDCLCTSETTYVRMAVDKETINERKVTRDANAPIRLERRPLFKVPQGD